MLKKLAGVLVLSLLYSCSPTPPLTKEVGTYIQDEPRNTASYQVQDEGIVVGYVHKYEWENRSGQNRHHHLVYDARGNVLGQVSEDGQTYRYLPGGELKSFGHKDLRDAIGIVFATDAPLRMVTADLDEEFVAWRKAGEAKRRAAVPPAQVSVARAGRSRSAGAEARQREEGFEGDGSESAFDFEDFEAAETARPAAETRRPAADARRPGRSDSGQGAQDLEEWPDEDEPWPGQK